MPDRMCQLERAGGDGLCCKELGQTQNFLGGVLGLSQGPRGGGPGLSHWFGGVALGGLGAHSVWFTRVHGVGVVGPSQAMEVDPTGRPGGHVANAAPNDPPPLALVPPPVAISRAGKGGLTVDGVDNTVSPALPSSATLVRRAIFRAVRPMPHGSV